MKLLFCLFKYFPFGGLQRDFRRIAEVCQTRGHSIHVLTSSWEGKRPSGFEITVVPKKGFTNHRRALNFARMVSRYLEREHFNAVIGFNKIPGLDLYYAADSCYKARAMEKGFLYRLGARYRTYAGLEQAVFAPSSRAHILLISNKEKAKFVDCYNTPDERFHSLPPGIARDRRLSVDTGEIRRDVRNELGVDANDFLLLMIGSGFKTKGLDRSILAISSLPEALRTRVRLFVVGRGSEKPFKNLAHKRGVARQVYLLGGREDIPRLLVGADLLLHPAYVENTGTVLIEAMVAGLPVLASDVCGYAYHVEKAGSGLLIPSPFEQQMFNRMLEEMLKCSNKEIWQKNGLKYTAENDVFGMPERAADIIEAVATRKRA